MIIECLTSKDITNIVANNKVIGQGSQGLIYKFTKDVLFKFRYKDFIECFDVENNLINLNKINDISHSIENIKNVCLLLNKDHDSIYAQNLKYLIKKQNDIKLTKLPIGIVLVDDLCVGSLIPFHNGYVNLFEYLQNNLLSLENIDLISKKMILAANELIENNIFHRDFTLRNIMYNPQNQDVQIIDFDDMIVTAEKVRSYEEEFRNRLKINIECLQNLEESSYHNSL